MLKKILSVSDVKKLQVGDQLCDNPDYTLAKTYTVQNISDSTIYAIHDDGQLELKMLNKNAMPDSMWWVKKE
jgi:hypothetical protein